MAMFPNEGQTQVSAQPMNESSVINVEPAQRQSLPNKLRHLALVLWVSFSLPIITSSYYLFGGTPYATTTPMRQSYRLIGSLCTEATALLVLWYVMDRQGRGRTQIGWSFNFLDILRALGLFIGSLAARYIVLFPFQYVYRSYSGHFLAAKSLNSMFGFGISFLSIAFICLNPFCEELIVRAYTMSEIINLGGSRVLAIIVSVAVQISYHLYQGLAHVVALTVIFTIYAMYFAKTKRIMPVILAHLYMDSLALLAGKF